MNNIEYRSQAALRIHKRPVETTDLYRNVLNAAGEYDAKVDSLVNFSLAAYLLNAVPTGVRIFVFNVIGPEDDYTDSEMHTTNQRNKDANKNRYLFQEGMTRNVEAVFRDTWEAAVNASALVALFGEYSGVGSAVARSYGSVGVQL